MFSEINENLIKAVIADYSAISLQIEKEIAEILNTGHENDNDLIIAASMPGRSNNEGHSNSIHDLFDVIVRYEKIKQGQAKNTSAQLIRLIEEQETVDRIYAAYLNIPAKFKEVLETIYNKDKTIVEDGVITLCHKYDKDRSTILRWRQKALSLIKELYNSDSSNLDFFKVVENISYR